MAQVPSEIGEHSVPAAEAATASSPPTDEIRSEVAQTRAEISATIDAIQTRLSPSHVIADARTTVTDAALGGVRRLADRTTGSGAQMLQILRGNPIPAVLLAVVGTSLFAAALEKARNRRRVGGTVARDRRDPRWPEVAPRLQLLARSNQVRSSCWRWRRARRVGEFGGHRRQKHDSGRQIRGCPTLRTSEVSAGHT